MSTLSLVLGEKRMQELSDVAEGSSLYGAMVRDMTPAERLATIGYLVEVLESGNAHLAFIKEKVDLLD